MKNIVHVSAYLSRGYLVQNTLYKAEGLFRQGRLDERLRQFNDVMIVVGIHSQEGRQLP